MALLWLDGFDAYGTSGSASPTGVVARKYASVAGSITLTVGAGRLGGYSLGTNYGQIKTPALTTDPTLIVGIAFKPSIATGILLALYDGSQQGVNVRLRGDYLLQVYRDTTLLGTSSTPVPLSRWCYIELKVLCSSSTGSFELRVNGVNVLSQSGINTKAGTHNYHDVVAVGLPVSSTAYYYDDFYVCDGSGSLNNDFLGGVRVVTLFPSADTATKEWTASSGTNHSALLNENPCDDNNNYVQDTVSSHTDLFDFQDTPATIASTVSGVQVNTDCRETDATPFSLKTVVVSGGTTDEGTASAIGTQSFTTKRRVVETDPNTGMAWTKTATDAAQFGMRVG